MARRPKTISDLLKSAVIVGDCLITNQGRVSINRVGVSVQRVLWTSVHGDINHRLVISASCGHNRCLNIKHIMATSRSDFNRKNPPALGKKSTGKIRKPLTNEETDQINEYKLDIIRALFVRRSKLRQELCSGLSIKIKKVVVKALKEIDEETAGILGI